MRSNRRKLKHRKFHLNIKKKEKSLHYEGGHTQEQITQRCCGVPILGDIQNTTGQGLEQPAVMDSVLSRGLDHAISRGACQAHPVSVPLKIYQ